MKSGRFSEEQIVGILKRQESGQKVADLAREYGISEATTYNWKGKYGGLEVSEMSFEWSDISEIELTRSMCPWRMDLHVSGRDTSVTSEPSRGSCA